MNKKFELLAPGGDIDSIKAAILSGADAIYCGLNLFNARNRATNLSFDNFCSVIKLAHKYNCKVFLTLNILILEQEIPSLFNLLNKLVNTKLDGVIVQDLGLFYILKHYFKTIEVHASTQVTTHNKEQMLFFKKLNASRVNLSRELNVSEIKYLTQTGDEIEMLSEVFVHGSYCVGFSGLCYMSSVISGNSGNRGRCSQPCRDKFAPTKVGVEHPLNMKDNSAFYDLKALSDAGVDSLKIEGRMKQFHYVYTIVTNWRKQLEDFYNLNQNDNSDAELYKVFNRDFSNGYLKADINKNMFIDSPRDNSLTHFLKNSQKLTSSELTIMTQKFYEEKSTIVTSVQEKIDKLTIGKDLMEIFISGQLNHKLEVRIKTSDHDFILNSKSPLLSSKNSTLNLSGIEKRFKGLNNSLFEIKQIDIKQLQEGLFIPFKELTEIKDQILFVLNDGVKNIAPITAPKLLKPIIKNETSQIISSSISVLISSKEDISLTQSSTAEIYYKLPDHIATQYEKLLEMFLANDQLIPWFPAILIGDDLKKAIELIKIVKPKKIVSDNTGVGFAAYTNKIDWIAGPHLNITNSFSLKCLKDEFNCVGAFLSNELNKMQIRQIIAPEEFKLYYSIYNPNLLLTSRQCLFHQSVGCKKDTMDDSCHKTCKKIARITDLKGSPLIINKQIGDYNSLYANENYLNKEIMEDFPEKFSSFFIDLRDIKKRKQSPVEKDQIIKVFQDSLNGDFSLLQTSLDLTSNNQYKKGL